VREATWPVTYVPLPVWKARDVAPARWLATVWTDSIDRSTGTALASSYP